MTTLLVRRFICIFLGIAVAGQIAVSASDSSSRHAIGDLIQQAGNAEDEVVRFQTLRELQAHPRLEENLRGELALLMPMADAWANGRSHALARHSGASGAAGRHNFLSSFIPLRPALAGADVLDPPEPALDSPLHPLWAWYRGRLLLWRIVQSAPLREVKERRDAYLGEAWTLLEEAGRAFPENRVIQMYLGRPIPWPEEFPADPQAPEWANLQREGLEKLTRIIHWWIDERQLPDGQFGGGWNDDVEMWRWWAPVMIGFEDEKIDAAQERLSRGLFSRAHMRGGFTSYLTDVEHSNEYSTDTIPPMMHLKPEDPEWSRRALRLAELMEERWTGRNERGFLQFKSIYFSVDNVDESPRRAFDTVYHPTIVQPSLLYWQRTRDPALTRLIGEWLKVWVDASARAENGKPAGVLPSAIAWPAGEIAVAGRPWWEPFPTDHNDMLYNWPGAAGDLASTLLLAWHVTGDERFLEPIRSMAELCLASSGEARGAAPGSTGWVKTGISRFLPAVLAKYRLLSGDTRYDELLRTVASGYSKFRMAADTAALVEDLRENAEAFRWNWEAYTSEMRWTDRVISFTPKYLDYVTETPPPAPSPDLLYSSVTGDPGGPLFFPLNAVRWLTPPRDIAALVVDSVPRRFEAELFHFGAGPRQLGAELLLLEPGTYELTLAPVGAPEGAVADRRILRVEGERNRVSFELPERRLCRLSIVPAGG